MHKLGNLHFLWYALFLTLSITSTTTQAQELNGDSDTPLGSASDLIITPRVGIGYNTSGAGYDGFTRFEGFVPLQQTPGRTLTFLQGQLLLDNSANLGGNILLGHRFYTPDANRIFGGYLAYDNRHTGNTTFHQLGIGLETLGSIWDVRLNGYLPIGETRQVVEERIIDTGFQLTDIFFQDHFLVQQARRERQEVRHLEAAMTGVDLEAGARLAQWGTTGELRGYAGLYYYDAAGTDGSLGWRLRLDIRPTDDLNLGVAFQEDELFGTNVLFSLGASWGGTSAAGKQEGNAVWARMGESVMRTASITVDGQTDIGESFQESTTIQATNPLTGEPYFFQQVNLQATGGNGTAENPFGTLAEALNAAQANQIVYVQGTTPPEIPGFTIPEGVSVLSTAPVQEIETVTFGRIPLPQSGSGTIPQIRGTVTMGNDTVLSGFAISNDQGSGIEAINISNAEIRDSQITSSTQAGVWLENVTGTMTLTNSEITGDTVASIIGTNVNNLTVTDGSLISRDSDTDGIKFDGVSGVVNISDSTITVTNAAQYGILATDISGRLNISANEGSQVTTATNGIAGIGLENATDTVMFSGLDISSTGGSAFQGNQVNNLAIANSQLSSSNSITGGISLDTVTGTVEITDSIITIIDPVNNTHGISISDVTGTVTIAANEGSEITTPKFGIELTDSPSGQFTISGFNIIDAQDSGIFGQNIGGVTFQGNTIRQATNQGIALNNVTGTVAIAGNTITNTGSDREIELPNGDTVPTGQGIAVANTTGQVDLSISGNNQISDNFNDAILLSFSGDAVANTVTITGNTLENNGDVLAERGDGIAMALDNTAIVDTLSISENTIRGNGDEGIDLRLGFFGENNARLENGMISNNLIEDNNNMGINLATANGGTQQLTVTQNRITNSGQQGINILAAVGSTQQITLSQNIIKDSGLEGVLFLTAENNNNSEFTVIENTIENSGNQGILILAVDDSRTIADIQRNTLANSNPIDFEVTVTPPGTFCLNLQENTSLENFPSTGYLLNNFGAAFLVVDLANLNTNNTPNNSVMLSSFSSPLDNLTTLTACP